MPEAQPNKEPRSAAFALRAAATAFVVVALGFAAFILISPSGRPRPSLIGGPFALENGDGKTVSDQTLRGRPFLVYFGYTHCPDVCPTELAHISDILSKMGNKAIPALFITVDPERDTPKIMQDYVSSFNPAIVGLSGSPQSVAATEKTFRCSPARERSRRTATIPWTTARSSISWIRTAPSSRRSTSSARLRKPPRTSKRACETRFATQPAKYSPSSDLANEVEATRI